MYKTALVAGILFAMTGVIFGAFGAHGLKPHLTAESAQTFEAAVRYQMYHAFALIFSGILYTSYPFKHVQWAAHLFIIGILCFSGSLYAMTILKMSGVVGLGGLGIITPIGGLFFIAGWVLQLLAIGKKK